MQHASSDCGRLGMCRLNDGCGVMSRSHQVAETGMDEQMEERHGIIDDGMVLVMPGQTVCSQKQ
jgi:hypothetical protein